MLRAGQSIEIHNDILNSQNCVMFAPIINLSGLVIRADQAISEPVQHFLAAHGAQIHRTRLKDEYHALLKYTFRLNKLDIEVFIQEHQALVDALKENLYQVSMAIKFKHTMSEKIAHFTDTKVYYIEEKSTITRGESSFSVENIRIQSMELMNQYNLADSKNIDLYSERTTIKGRNKNNFGLFNESMALKNFNIELQKITLENTVAEAGEKISITSKDMHLHSMTNIKLRLQTNWLNNPPPEIHSFIKEISTDELFAQADELQFNIRTGAN